MYLRPSEIYYTQDSISNTFGRATRHSNMYVGDTLDGLINKSATVTNIPRISVFWLNGKWFTHDNRRLWVFRTAEELGILNSIPVYETSGVDSSKFTTCNGGSSVRVRGIAGGSVWRQLSQSLNLTSMNYNDPGTTIYSRPEEYPYSTQIRQPSSTLPDYSHVERSYQSYSGSQNYSRQRSNEYAEDRSVRENVGLKCALVGIFIIIFLVLVALLYT